MPEFQLTTEYSPKGDQPQAIEQLVAGAQADHRFQTLLGVTGSGKSLPPDEPVWLWEGVDGELVPRLSPIGPFVDGVLNQEARVRRNGDTEIALLGSRRHRYHTLSLNPRTLAAELRPLTAVHRHCSPAMLWEVATACGRSVRVTGDHNLWVLREGRLQLLETHQVRAGDYLPIPIRLPAPPVPLLTLSLLQFMEGRRVFVDCRAQLARLNRADLCRLESAMRAEGRSCSHGKLARVVRSGERVLLQDAQALEAHGVPLRISHASVGLRSRGRELPLMLPVTADLLELLGCFIAEGHAEPGYFMVSCADSDLQQRLERCLEALGLTWFVRTTGYDYVISWRLYAQLFATWCGRRAREKRLPPFWPELDERQLATLLSAYFTGDGGVDHDEVTVATASAGLASDLCYALSRYGIWARVYRRFKRATNSAHPGDWYYRLSISGVDQLRQFADSVNFLSDRKREQLQALLGGAANTNVDLIPVSGADLRQLRGELRWLQRDVSSRAGCSRSLVSLLESGKRKPSRALFGRLMAVFRQGAREQNRTLLLDTIEGFERLASVRWTPIASVSERPSETSWVYDLSVLGNETFLAGSGGLFVHNTFTAASAIARLQRPTLVIAHNKTLAAQLCSEFREFFPPNAVEYFVSYYDYYQPEAYIPQTDTYIEKDSSINDEIDRLRHSATQSLLERRDVVVVASVSCIYGLGSPEEYLQTVLALTRGKAYDRRATLRQLVDMQFVRNEMALGRGTFRAKGDVLEIWPADEEILVRVDFFGDEVDKIQVMNPLTGEVINNIDRYTVFPASHFVTSRERLERAIETIQAELKERLEHFQQHGQLLEAQRLEQRTLSDIEMMREVGYCNGIENYSRHLDGRLPGTPPNTLLDYFPRDFLLIIDESHQTIPQLHGMYAGDMSRKDNLVEYGFRLPSARDNRPLRWEEFLERVGQTVFVSATPGPYEREVSAQTVEQIVRPTGLVDPEVEVRPTRGQIDDLIGEIRGRVEAGERVLVTTLTKKMAEDLSEYLLNLNLKVQYLHSDIKTLERLEILRDLRLGVHDVVVGINLLREGLDLPEVSLVAILDADKEGFLRSETSLIQTIGRAARNVGGKVLMYADGVTGSMRRAIDETDRRRAKQVAHNSAHGITPETVRKAIRDVIRMDRVAEPRAEYDVSPDAQAEHMPLDDLLQTIQELEGEMRRHSKALEFEAAARYRDEINRLKRLLPDAEFAASIAPAAVPARTPARSGRR